MADFSTNTTTNTSAMEYLVGKTVDTVLEYSPATLFFLGNQKKWRGTQMRVPIKYAKNTQGLWFDGLQKFSTTDTTNFVNMTFNPTGRSINVVVPQMEVDVNETAKVIDIIARKTASAAQDMAEDVANSFHTLQAGIAFNSLIDACDDGSIGAGSYGGLSRTDYSTLAGNYSAAGGNLTLTILGSAFNSATHGKDSPNLILTTKAIFNYYEKLLTPTVSTQVGSTAVMGYASFVGATANGLPNITAPGSKLSGYQGFNAIYYRGVPVVADEATPSGYLYMLNTRNIAFYGVKSTDPDYQAVKFTSDAMDSVYNIPVTTGFSFSGFNKPIDQYGKVGHIILMGNLICDNPRNQAIVITITGA